MQMNSFINRYLSPADRMAELVCGLVMVLTFTLTAGITIREEEGAVRELLLATIGCNLAWGMIDGVAFVMSRMASRDTASKLLRTIQGTADKRTGLDLLAEEFDGAFAQGADPAERAELYERIHRIALKIPPQPSRIHREDFLGALAILLIDFICTIPAAIPFLIFHDKLTALRVSNALLLASLFVVGNRWAATTHGRPIRTGFAFASVGLVLVGVAILLGG
jgi:hypothetical protein